MDVEPRRPRLLIAALVCFGCGSEPDATFDSTAIADRALDYLETTTDEFGLDVVVMLQIFAESEGDERAASIAAARRAALPPDELARYGQVLDVEKAPFSPFDPSEVAPAPGTPNPADDLGDDRAALCPAEVLECTVSPGCAEFVGLDGRWGYVLTHQAVWVLFARWMSCSTGVDLDARRRLFARNLLEEARVDATASDLFFERLAMIGYLGAASEIDGAWLDELVRAQDARGCFPVSDEVPCHPHPTGLVLWTLAGL